MLSGFELYPRWVPLICSQTVTEEINAPFLLLSKIKIIGMLLNVVQLQVHKNM